MRTRGSRPPFRHWAACAAPDAIPPPYKPGASGSIESSRLVPRCKGPPCEPTSPKQRVSSLPVRRHSMLTFPTSRRSAFAALLTFAAVAAMPLPSPAQDDIKRGGTLVVGYTQTPRHLNGAVQSGIATALPVGAAVRQPAALRRQMESAALPRREVDARGRRQVAHAEPAQGRRVPRRQADHVGRRRVLDHGDQGQPSVHRRCWGRWRRSRRPIRRPPSSA